MRSPTRPQIPRQVALFLLVGVGGTAAYLVGYALLRVVFPAQPANVVARIAVAVLTTWVNGRITFAHRTSAGRLLGGAAGGLVLGIVVSAAALATLTVIAPEPTRVAELTTLLIANVVAAAGRFLFLRSVVFRPTTPPGVPVVG